MVKRIVVGAALALSAACGISDDVSKVPREEYPDAGGAGGAGESSDPGGTSGSRLRRVLKQSSDGATEFVTWYDSERDEDCQFMTLDQLRVPINKCLPATPTRGAPTYADAGCTQPIYARDRVQRFGRAGNPLREYIITAWGPEGDFVHVYVPSTRTFYEHSTSYFDTIDVFQMGPNQPCHAYSFDTGGSWVYMDEISIDDFVSWTEVVE